MDRLARLRRRWAEQRGQCYERDFLFAESLAAAPAATAGTRGQPLILRQAKALAHTLEHITIGIGRDELVVGLHPKRDDPLPCPAFAWPRPEPDLSPRQRLAQSAGVYWSGPKTAHLAIDTRKLLAIGLGGLRADLERRLASARGEAADFLEAARISVNAASRFIRRYAKLAAELANSEAGPRRRAELAEIARVCAAIAEGPPRSFREAVQLVLFEFLVRGHELSRSHGAYGIGRIDQCLGPFYERDLAEGRITPRAAQALVDCLFIKLNEIEKGITALAMTVGGADLAGRDVCNRVTRLVLRAAARTRMPTLNVSFRWHPKVDRATWRLALRTASHGGAQPAFYNDAVIRAAVEHAGVSHEDAVDALPVGCVELSVEGKTNPWVGNFFNLAKCLELALRGGRDASGQQVGPATPVPASFDALLAAYKEQVRYLLELMIDSENKHDALEMAWRPLPFVSALVADCLDRGRHITAGGARYNFTELQGVGIANVADSLMAVRRHVFETRRLTYGALLAALDANFKGHEATRQLLRTRTPRYGNDEPEADALAREAVEHFYACVEGHRNPRGGTFHPGLLVWTLHGDWASATGALPDGRRRGEPLVSSIGPSAGFDRKGPTAVIKSATAFGHVRSVGGLSLNLSLHPSCLEGEDGLEHLSQLTTTYFQRGGMQVQLNVVRREQLLEAQAHPETGPFILVRVSGFSADFLTLSRTLQDEIIRRTEHSL